MSSHRSELTQSQSLRRRILALLASGLVLGVGAAATLAAWNDSEHTSGSFTAGSFGIIGSTDGTTFSEHNSGASAASLTFSAQANGLYPGASTYALFSVKTLNPSVAGTVQLNASSANASGLGEHLEYGVRVISGTTCDATAFNGSLTDIVPSGSALDAHGTNLQSLGANGADQVNFCFNVTMPTTTPNAAQNLTVAPTWEFVATSSTS